METPSLEGLPTKAKEDPSPHEMRLCPTGHQLSISWSRGNYYYDYYYYYHYYYYYYYYYLIYLKYVNSQVTSFTYIYLQSETNFYQYL